MYEGITYETILDRMLSRVSNQFDKREGSVIFDTHSPTAIELQILYLELDTILKEAYGDTASREFLIRRCAERGITPYEATQAVLKGEFTPTNIELIGKRFNIGESNFVAVEKIADGVYKMQCEDAGIIGNQQLGVMLPIEYIDGLETAVLTEVLIPGESEEDTEDLRKRYFDSFSEKAFGGNVQDYLEKTNAIAGVGSTKVTRVWNGDIQPAAMIPNAKVKAWYAEIKKTVSTEVLNWLSAVYTAAEQKKLTTGGTVLLTIVNSDYGVASDTLIQTVQNTIDPPEQAGNGYGLAPIGHVVSVKGAVGVPIAVKAKITFDTGYSWSNLQNSIDAAIESYLLELRKSWADTSYLIVRVSQIETRLLGISGIIDIDDTQINGSTDNVTLGAYEIPIFGGASA
nr:MAG TPA: Baseplate J like protein [Caudoviricetes sp.]